MEEKEIIDVETKVEKVEEVEKKDGIFKKIGNGVKKVFPPIRNALAIIGGAAVAVMAADAIHGSDDEDVVTITTFEPANEDVEETTTVEEF